MDVTLPRVATKEIENTSEIIDQSIQIEEIPSTSLLDDNEIFISDFEKEFARNPSSAIERLK